MHGHVIDQGDSVLTLTFVKSGFFPSTSLLVFNFFSKGLDALLCLEGTNIGLLPLEAGELGKCMTFFCSARYLPIWS